MGAVAAAVQRLLELCAAAGAIARRVQRIQQLSIAAVTGQPVQLPVLLVIRLRQRVQQPRSATERRILWFVSVRSPLVVPATAAVAAAAVLQREQLLKRS